MFDYSAVGLELHRDYIMELRLRLQHIINHSTCLASSLTTGQDFRSGFQQETGARNSTFQSCCNLNRLSISTFLNCFKRKQVGLGSTQFSTPCWFWSLIWYDLNSKRTYAAKPNRFPFNISPLPYTSSSWDVILCRVIYCDGLTFLMACDTKQWLCQYSKQHQNQREEQLGKTKQELSPSLSNQRHCRMRWSWQFAGKICSLWPCDNAVPIQCETKGISWVYCVCAVLASCSINPCFLCACPVKMEPCFSTNCKSFSGKLQVAVCRFVHLEYLSHLLQHLYMRILQDSFTGCEITITASIWIDQTKANLL